MYYFKIGRMKGICIWKHWKTPQNRAKNLVKLGISRKFAWSTAYYGAHIARVCQGGAMNMAVTKETNPIWILTCPLNGV